MGTYWNETSDIFLTGREFGVILRLMSGQWSPSKFKTTDSLAEKSPSINICPYILTSMMFLSLRVSICFSYTVRAREGEVAHLLHIY